MKQFTRHSLATLISATVVSGFSVAHAETNPFAFTELNSGYMQVATAETQSAPVAAPAKTTETPAPAAKSAGHCPEGKCGEMMKPQAAAAKTTEAKCGESKCGAMMQDGKMKPGMEASCGGMMKGKEGSCGMMGNMSQMDHGNAAAATAPKTAEAKCGESKCGAMMQDGKMKSGMEASCGAMMKGKEAACGNVKPATAEKAAATETKPAAPVAKAAPSTPTPAAAPRATANKTTEGQCAAVIEQTHDKPHELSTQLDKRPWGNRKAVVNP